MAYLKFTILVQGVELHTFMKNNKDKNIFKKDTAHAKQ